MRYIFNFVKAAVIGIMVFLSWTVSAEVPTQEELLKALIPPPEAKSRSLSDSEVKPKSRGVEVIENPPFSPETGKEKPTEQIIITPPTVQLQQIAFEFNSVKLTQEACQVLDNLAAVIVESALKNSHFKITGHTDAVGGDAFNVALSLRRARSVKTYLVNKYHIEASRLQIEGKGFRELLDNESPDSAVNRRVQITNLGEI